MLVFEVFEVFEVFDQIVSSTPHISTQANILAAKNYTVAD
jgi:hypothetical protein